MMHGPIHIKFEKHLFHFCGRFTNIQQVYQPVFIQVTQTTEIIYNYL